MDSWFIHFFLAMNPLDLFGHEHIVNITTAISARGISLGVSECAAAFNDKLELVTDLNEHVNTKAFLLLVKGGWHALAPRLLRELAEHLYSVVLAKVLMFAARGRQLKIKARTEVALVAHASCLHDLLHFSE